MRTDTAVLAPSMTYSFFTVDESVRERAQPSLVTSTAIGVFRTDPRTLMERYFDIHLALSPWGTREVIIRLPRDSFSIPLAQEYGVEAWSTGEHTLVAFRTDFARTPKGKADFPLSRLVSVRADLAAGDRRALYLGWLALLGSPDHYGPEELPELELDMEPPVPAGLGALHPGLTMLAEILCVDPRLLRAAAVTRPVRAGAPRRSAAALLRAASTDTDTDTGRREAV
ncbi:hypothetical protein ACFPM3_02010 [Streptomyces coeruleoprunus]|uniref:Uncharacterized protein n=1 Tax=Streptomyces coeruleoprunus TaxID=285563 RepID=A0ABV9X902_9ACTN